jgi:putative SOS response-associated peptidase YedK
MIDLQAEPAIVAFHFGVVAEALRSDIRQIAEDHTVIRDELQEMRREFRDDFKEMRALVPLSFAQRDQLLHPRL